MRILMTGSEWFDARPGGLNRYFNDLYTSMSRRTDIVADGVAFGSPPPGARSWGPLGKTLLQRYLESAEDPSNFDVVDRHFALYGRYPLRRLRPNNALSVVHFHGPWAAESAAASGASLSNKFKFVFESGRYQRADVAIVLSDAFKRLLVEDYDLDESTVHVIPPGVRMPEHQEASLPGRRPVMLCVRRLEKRMGIDVLLKAWEVVRRSIPDAELRIIGDGTESHSLRAQAARGSGSVTFLGRVSDATLAAEYTNATATVVPSVALEGFGLIALESLARGRAPVVTDCGGLPDSVRGLDSSLIVPPSSPDALSDRLIKALSGDVPSAESCIGHARQFSWEASVRRHLEVYAAASAA